MEMLRMILSDTQTDRRKFVLMLMVSAIGTTLIVALVNRAVHAEEGSSHFGLAMAFLTSVVVFTIAQRYVMMESAQEAERMIERLRIGIMNKVRMADLKAMQGIGRAPIYAALTREAQTISTTLPVIIIGAQQSVLLIFVSFYLAYLSLVAFALVGVFGVCAIWFHITRLRMLQESTGRLNVEQGKLFEEFRGVLSGFRELTLNERRGDSILRRIALISDEARVLANEIKATWAREYVLTQTLFYILLGLMVFIVPNFTESYHDVVVQATIGALFMIGPLGALAQSIPALNDAARALHNMRSLEDGLTAAVAETVDEEAEPLEAQAHQVMTLEGLEYAFEDGNGQTSFALGPISATFNAGEVTFITGGNGSGKSTLFRLMTGLVHPMRGHISLDGTAVRLPQYSAYRDQIGVVFADYYLFDELHGLEHLPPARISSVLRMMELSDKVRFENGAFTTTDLSAGQRKRLALAVAILQDTPILMLDEWAADQDPQFRRTFYEALLPDLRDQGKIVVCITHDDRYFGVADRVYHMVDGKMSRER
jgi:putative ATP-binding cassette transporter